jgi:hypothetical protein
MNLTNNCKHDQRKNGRFSLAALLTAALLGACDSGPDPPRSPSGQTNAPSGQSNAGVFVFDYGCTQSPYQPHALVGQVFDAYSGVVADASAELFVEFAVNGRRHGEWCYVRTDQSGQFVLYAPDSTINVHFEKPGFVQPCAVAAEVPGPELRVEVTSTSTLESLDPPRPQSTQGASLTGVIFEVTNGVRKPIAGAKLLAQRFDGIDVATTVSDLQGRYFLCNLPAVARVWVIKPGLPPEVFSIDSSQTTRDIELYYGTEVAGTVHEILSDSVFRIGRQRIVRPPEVAASETIVAGSYVRVRGTLNGDELYATEILVSGAGPDSLLDGQIEAIDVASRTFRLLGIELFVNESTQMRNYGGRTYGGRTSLHEFAIGEWVSVRAQSNRLVQWISGRQNYTASSDAVQSRWFTSVSPPSGFTLDGVADFPVQVTPATALRLGEKGGDGDCYDWHLVSTDDFWQRASEPRHADDPAVHAWGRFEGGLLIADTVYVCYALGHGHY